MVESAVTFTATVTSKYGLIPDGETVTFFEGGRPIGTGATSGEVATFSTAALPVGKHTIKATYPGDTTFQTSSGTVQQTVDVYATTTTLPDSPTSPNPSGYGQSITLTAVVSNMSGSITPTGTVTFLNGATKLGTATLSSGAASFTTAGLPLGSDALTASYGGDGNDAPSTSSTFTQTVNQATSMTQVTSSLNPSLSGQQVKFTITVTDLTSPTTTPTGTVTLIDCGQNAACPTPLQLGTATLNNKGSATISYSDLTVNNHYIEAQYQGTSDISASTSSPIVQTVNAYVTYTANPLNFGTVAPGETETRKLGVTNKGLDPLTVSGTPTFSGLGATQFAVLSGSCLSGIAIPPQASCEMDIQFTSPAGSGTTYNPSLQFTVVDEDGVSNQETDVVTAMN